MITRMLKTLSKAFKPVAPMPGTLASLLLLLSPFAIAESSVWEITKGENKLYLGGTIHILTSDDYPLPAVYDYAYDNSSITVFETDISAMNDRQFQQKLLSQVTYSDGSSLLDYLSETTRQQLIDYCQANGIPTQAIFPMKAGMASMTLTMIELQKLGLVGAGVDEFYNTKSVADQRQLDALESLDQQIQIVTEMGQGNEDALIQYTLDDIGRLGQVMQAMKKAWRGGDVNALEKLVIPELKKFPGVHKSLLVTRNSDWLPKLEAMLETAEVEYVLVGAAHLVGEHGLLAAFKARGYQIKQLQSDN